MKLDSRVTVKGELEADSKDIYNKYVKWVVMVFLGWYVFRVIMNKTEEMVGVGEGGIRVSIARDSGLKMIVSEFPSAFLPNLHAISGILLCALVLVQKQNVLLMMKSYKTYAFVHKWLGYIILGLISAMVYGGYMLGKFSAFKGFDVFSVFFAAPWVIWIACIYYTARPSMISIHRLLSNMMLKGCIATPLSRIAGALLQRVEGWDEESGFYQGIGGVSMIIALWQIYETCIWWIHIRKHKKH